MTSRFQITNKLFFYFTLSLTILLPILLPGYVFALDMVFGPEIRMPAEVTASYPFYLLLKIFSFVLPVWVVQKLLLMVIVVLCGISAHKLADSLQVTANSKGSNVRAGRNSQFILHDSKSMQKWVPFYAGLLYIFNPFTYTRFMDGQFLVLLGYALLPFFVKALFQLFFDKKFTRKSSLRVALYALAISIVSIHAVGYLVVISLVALGIYVWHERQNKTVLAAAAKYSGLALVIFITLSSYWIVPTILNDTPREQLVQSFDDRYLLSFRTDGANDWTVTGNTVTMHGYWGDREGRYILPRSVTPLWPLLIAAMVALAGYGFYKTKHNPRSQTVLISAGVAVVLAIGIAATPFNYVTEFLANYMPFYRGFREPQKFVSVLVLFYSVLGAIGLHYLLQHKKFSRISLAHFGRKPASPVLNVPSVRLRSGARPSSQTALSEKREKAKDDYKTWILIGALALPLLYTPTMLWGFAGQLKSRHYPADWAHINNDYVKNAEGKILFLPWHQYMYFDFAGRVIANPGPVYFGNKIVAGDNAEIGLIERQVSSERSDAIDAMIANKDMSNLGSEFAYVLLAKDADWQEYAYLDVSRNLELVRETETLKLYKVLR